MSQASAERSVVINAAFLWVNTEGEYPLGFLHWLNLANNHQAS